MISDGDGEQGAYEITCDGCDNSVFSDYPYELGWVIIVEEGEEYHYCCDACVDER